MRINSKSFNLQVLLEMVSCTGFAGMLFYLLKSQMYLNYVTPRMRSYFYFAIFVMLLWAVSGINRIFSPQYHKKLAPCLILFVPAVFLFLPHDTVNTVDFRSTTKQYQYTQKLKDQETNSAAVQTAGIQQQMEFSDVFPGLDGSQKNIVVSNDDFGLWVSEISVNPLKYVNYKIQLTGFVYKDPESFEENEFMTSRLLMTCCVADLSPVGLICQYDKTRDLKSDSWVTVEGLLFTKEYEYNGQVCYTPELAVTSIQPAEEVTGYVYSY